MAQTVVIRVFIMHCLFELHDSIYYYGEFKVPYSSKFSWHKILVKGSNSPKKNLIFVVKIS